MSTIFLCFDISDVEAVVVNEQCRNQNATSKKIWFHFAALSRTQSQFCSYCIWAPNVFQFALNCWENQRKKNCVEITRSKAALRFFYYFFVASLQKFHIWFIQQQLGLFFISVFYIFIHICTYVSVCFSTCFFPFFNSVCICTIVHGSKYM